MRVIHSLDNKSIIEKDIEERVGFLLTNQLGGYLSLFSHPLSRYQGWFALVDGKMFKIIENLEIQKSSGVEELRNNFWNIERKRGNIIESFFLPSYYNSLVYEVSEPTTVELTLDIKESYDNQEFGRQYEVFEEKGIVIVKYSRDSKDVLYLAIKPDSLNYSKIGQWLQRNYQLDQERNSPPFERYVYKALRLKGQKFVFSAAKNKKEAVKETQKVFRKAKKLKKLEERKVKKSISPKKIKGQETKMAYLCAQNSLNSLQVLQDEKVGFYPNTKNFGVGVYAGLPWFFQFWTRDEAISLKSLNNFNSDLSKKILLRLLRSIREDGRTPNVSFGKMPLAPSESADGVGWVFKRIADFISDKSLKRKEIREIKKHLTRAISGLLAYHTKNNFAASDSLETWMDTIDRVGPSIEIQALRLNMYKLAFEFTKEPKYSKLEKQLRKQVREKFWSGEFLADGLSDFTSRPNIFLAAYIYPELLSKKEWLRCFENILPKLWLEWGGITTIDKRNPLFVGKHTGENPKSYHQGDSWFYINNLTALVLYRFSRKKFKKYIDKILEASTKEILWQGAIGHNAELSSASEFKSEGSWAQAWSSALYIEAIKEILDVRRPNI